MELDGVFKFVGRSRSGVNAVNSLWSWSAWHALRGSYIKSNVTRRLTKYWMLQLMDNNLILPGGAIVVDNTLMKVPRSHIASPISHISRIEQSYVHSADPNVNVLCYTIQSNGLLWPPGGLNSRFRFRFEFLISGLHALRRKALSTLMLIGFGLMSCNILLLCNILSHFKPQTCYVTSLNRHHITTVAFTIFRCSLLFVKIVHHWIQ